MFKKRNTKEQKPIDFSDQQQKQIQGQKLVQASLNQKQNQDYVQGALPSKKIKTEFTKSVLTSTTTERKQKNAEQLHKNFKSLNYKADQNIRPEQVIKNADEALKLEEQIAKQKFLQNVEMTKLSKQGKIDPKVYRGINSYANHSLTEDQIKNAQENYKKRCGPSRVSSTIKNTCRFDYNLSLCKDWHDSGYCPFGNSCIYLHDRSNYKTGWEQQKDFQRAQKQRWRRINNPDLAIQQQIQESLKSIQKYKVDEFCGACKNPFKNPVQVDCGHIFCSSCAIKMNKCINCKKSLSGIMNAADKKLQKMKQTYSELKAKIQKQNEQNRVKRKKHINIQSQDVFAD